MNTIKSTLIVTLEELLANWKSLDEERSKTVPRYLDTDEAELLFVNMNRLKQLIRELKEGA